ncbi:MAG TPA: WG repeat-containing protein, partial [Clostridia bacterium]|nr:WG repeat-containing protein [Clostridia bacterium]
MKKAGSTAIILLLILVLTMSSCGKANDPLNLGLPSINAEGLDGESLDEARKLAGWQMDPTGTFSYLEYFPQGSSRPFFDETYEFNDNYFIYQTTYNGDKMYGYMDTEFSKLTGPLSLEPGVFMYNLARIVDDSGVHAIDNYFLPVDTYLDNFAKKGSTLIKVSWTNQPDKTPVYMDNIDYNEYLVPVMVTSNMETGRTVDGRLYGYKTFNDAYIGDPNGETKFRIEPIFDEARGFYHGLAAVKLGGKWGFIDENGDIVVGIQYDDVSDFDGTTAGVFLSETTVGGRTVNDRWALVDKDGNLLTEFMYAMIGEFEDGIAIADLATLTSSNRNGVQTRITQVFLKANG